MPFLRVGYGVSLVRVLVVQLALVSPRTSVPYRGFRDRCEQLNSHLEVPTNEEFATHDCGVGIERRATRRER